jgi:hypothetical protein
VDYNQEKIGWFEEKSPDYSIFIFYKKVQGNWYKQEFLDLRVYQDLNDATKGLLEETNN